MKKAVICASCALIFALMLLPGPQCRAATIKEDAQTKRDIDKAAKDVAKNTTLLISLREKVFPYTYYWNKTVADKIPEQTAAVISIIAESDVYEYRLCPRQVVDNEISFEQYVLWLKKSARALKAISFKDLKKERIRKECLGAIERELDRKKERKNYSRQLSDAMQDTEPQAPFEISKAAKDVAKNFDLLLFLRKKKYPEDDYTDYWNKTVANRIPDQPEAVILLMERTNVPVKEMCPREVMDGDMSFAEYELWMKKSMRALKALSLKNPKQERIRKECLKEIEKYYATRKAWED